jgi:hypothetical protein
MDPLHVLEYSKLTIDLLGKERESFHLGLRAVSEVSTYGGHVMDMADNHR